MQQQSSEKLFSSFFMGGFECSTQRMPGGERLDMVGATGHDVFAEQDFQRLRSVGMSTAREGLRWHLIQTTPGAYDFSTAIPIVRAALKFDIQLIWDLCHYGWPDWLDIFSAEFPVRFSDFAYAFIEFLKAEGVTTPFITPINEISFFAWASGAVAAFFPYQNGRGDELKDQLVLASIRGCDAAWASIPQTRIVTIDPLINVMPNPARPEDAEGARAHNRAQFAAWDMLSGNLKPELGGGPKYLDIIGVNYYVHNQWYFPGGHNMMIDRTHAEYKPLWQMLKFVSDRYLRPIFIAETGIEDEARPEWLNYVCGEVHEAAAMGIPVNGICLYPILNHPGWADQRHCHNGLWDYADEVGNRAIYQPLADEIERQQAAIAKVQQ